MYKFDEEFRPPGRVFLKAKHEKPSSSSGALVAHRGSAITTSVDKGIKFRHDVIHEKSVEAVITDYSNRDSRNQIDRTDVVDSSGALVYSVPVRDGDDLQQITRNKRLSTEVIGNRVETAKTSARGADGHRRHVTHIVRKVTTLSRAEERAQSNNMIKFSNDKKTTELGYMSTHAMPLMIEQNKRVKVIKSSAK